MRIMGGFLHEQIFSICEKKKKLFGRFYDRKLLDDVLRLGKLMEENFEFVCCDSFEWKKNYYQKNQKI